MKQNSINDQVNNTNNLANTSIQSQRLLVNNVTPAFKNTLVVNHKTNSNNHVRIVQKTNQKDSQTLGNKTPNKVIVKPKTNLVFTVTKTR